MRLMIRWSPMSRVLSMEPERMTRAWLMATLMSRKTRPTQNQAIISRWIFVFTGTFASGFFFFSAFTLHHHRPLCGPEFTFHCSRRSGCLPVGRGLADFQLHEIRWIDARITRRTKPAFGIGHSLPECGKGKVAEGIGADKFTGLFGRVRRSNQLFARGGVHAVVAGRNRGRTTDAHVDFFGAGLADHANDFAAGGATDNRVVDKDDALAFDEAANRIEF